MSHHGILKILFEDSHIIAVNKASNILSVQGKPNQILKPRYEQWKDIIHNVYNSKRLPTSENTILKTIINYDSIPRTKQKFISFLSKISKHSNLELHEKIWNELLIADFDFNRHITSLKPSQDISVPEILEEKMGHRIYHVHRLDLETSGVILYAKSSQAASNLMKQFQSRMIHKTYMAKVIGLVPLDLKKIELPIRPDYENRPRQVC